VKVTSVRPLRHGGLKLVSIALAVALWMAVSGEEIVERGLRVPLELQQFPSGLELAGDAPTVVDVRVRGGSDTLSRLAPGEVMAVLDLRAARPGRRLYQLGPNNVRTPFGVEVVQVTPSSVAMAFENSVTRELPVVAAIEGDPAPGFVVGTITTDPQTVEVMGPESSVARVTEALTEPVSITGARVVTSETVNIGFLDPLLRLKDPRQASVRVEVLPGPRERTLDNQPVRLRNLDRMLSARAIPPEVRVVLRGSREGVDRVVPSELAAFVNLAGLGIGDYTLPVEVDTSRDAGVIQINPAVIQVRLSAKD
jgi:YbbR domain-containing protein